MPAVMLGVFALTLFCSASLLFLVEPMVGKLMLPLLGGTPAVWNTCMVFFQAALLAGYGYAHATTSWLGPRKQAAAHLLVLVLPLLFFMFNGPLYVNPELIAGRESNPIPALLLVLTLSVGIPMFVICTSAPLLQRWFASTDHPAAQDPYFLYGASNLGSMLALLGYPAIVEPLLPLRSQRVDWAIGYGVLTLMTAGCAWLMWKSKPALVSAPVSPTKEKEVLAPPANASTAFKAARKEITRDRGQITKKPTPASAPVEQKRIDQPVTWRRRMYWMALALVPSSMMLGATTYITTDIAAIPLLWVLPLALYLLSFIIVFAHISPRTQSIVTVIGLMILSAGLAYGVADNFFAAEKDESVRWLIYCIGAVAAAITLKILPVRDPSLIHRVMIMIMPLVVLLIVFMILSDIRPGIVGNIGLHLATLFVVSMVCHGELAQDRPAPNYLTEFFLWMSIGGVVGGLFNALFAPIAFSAIVEYQLVMMVACLLLPPLGLVKDSVWARRADLGLAAIFLGVGTFLLIMCKLDKLPDLEPLKTSPWQWGVAALLLAGALGGFAAYQGWGSPPAAPGEPAQNHWLDRVLDVGLPLALMVLVTGLYWGLPAKGVAGRMTGFANLLGMEPSEFLNILRFGLPAVLCYTFVERSVRFGLGVGAILLSAAFCTVISDSPLFQDRSFFGVLRVEEGDAYLWEVRNNLGRSVFTTSVQSRNNLLYDGGTLVDLWKYETHRLTHGTTLHGKQLLDPNLRDLAISYYHRTGPIGHILRNYNTDPNRPMAVIGLGTGSMACYAMKGQTLDFFDIDPVVLRISYDTDEFFSFIEDAEDRGAKVGLVLGDARLTFEPKREQTRLKPMRNREKKALAERKHLDPLTPKERYGLIIVDAFSSDAIPVHLITKEALAIYRERLLPDGVLCMHISNRYLDLQPVLANIVGELGMAGYHMSDNDSSAVGKNTAHWVAIAREPKHLEKLLHPERWKHDNDQAMMLGAALWPAPAGTSEAAFSGLAYMFHRVIDMHQIEKEKKTGKPTIKVRWKPLETPAEMVEQLKSAEKEVKQRETEVADLEATGDEGRISEAKNNLEVARNNLKEVEQTIKYNNKVGVWSDDYSNLLSVFSWK